MTDAPEVKALDEAEVASVRARFTGPRCAERFCGDDDDPDAGRCDLSAGHDGLHCWGTLSRDEIARLLATLDETRAQLAEVVSRAEKLAAALARAERADRPAPERDEAHLRQHTAPGWWQVWGADLCVALLKAEDMGAIGNYVADAEESPRSVLFADGRTVTVGEDGALHVGRDDKRAREVFWSKKTRPEPEKET